MASLAAELTDATAEGDAESLAAIAWQLYGEAGENLAEIDRLRAAIHAACRPRGLVTPTPVVLFLGAMLAAIDLATVDFAAGHGHKPSPGSSSAGTPQGQLRVGAGAGTTPHRSR
jgi:hypothetical protein